ncbi:MAG: CPBP family intramembrane metalloprotease [Bacteroidetes bacterium]|nr:CPBP family intramembrane metalloprotease [Bacteroidota bacterium]
MKIETDPILANYSAPLKLIALLILLILSLLFTSLFGIAFALPFWGFDVLELTGSSDYSNPSTISLLKYLQVVNQLGLFIFPPLLFAYWVSRKIATYLLLNIKPQLRVIVISIMIIFVSLPFISWLAEINQTISLPESLSGIENWMERMESKANDLILAFLNVKSLGGMMFNIFMIAIIPAVGEEFLFRGVILRLFKEWTKNVHIAVLISAFLFSALHMQFYGFIPRLLLGVILGYLFVWSGSLWIPMLIHFINNAFAIIYIYATGSMDLLNSDIDSIGASDNSFIIATSAVFMIFMMLILYKWYRDKQINESGIGS